jgi:hypothetical protein
MSIQLPIQKLLQIGSLLFAALVTQAQTNEAFDLARYRLPAGFSRDAKDNYVLHQKVDQTTGSWCQVILYKSVGSSGTLEGDFDHEWDNLIAKNYAGATKTRPERTEENGWTAQTAATRFDFQGQTAYALLTAVTGYGRLMSVVITMNNESSQREVDRVLSSIQFSPPIGANASPTGTTTPTNPPSVGMAGTHGISKSTTNFNDGWVATLARDKVVVTKGAVRVYLYFPLAHTDASRQAGRDYYWDQVLPRYFRLTRKQYRDHGEVMSSFQAPYIEGAGVELETGQTFFLALYVTSANGNMIPVLAMAPDEVSMRRTFPKAEDQFESDLARMWNYNRFAVTTGDLIGKWKGGDFAAANYYSVYTGGYAGMGAVAMSDRFEFLADGKYNSQHQGASGMVGSMATYSQKYEGRATVNDWSIALTNRFEGKSTTFNAWFEAVPGGRVLHLQDAQYSGIKYDLVIDR